MWVFIFGDIINFTLLFGIYLYYRSQNVALFTEYQGHLREDLAILNTFLLLTSSLFIAVALSYLREGNRRAYWNAVMLTALFGGGFVVVKFVEYYEKYQQSISIVTNDFYMYYYIMTVIHLLHVVIGLAMLILMLVTSRDHRREVNVKLVECGCVYWHMVDFLWIIIFPLLYLVR